MIRSTSKIDRFARRNRRGSPGLTVVELLMSLTITVMIGMAMTGVIGAVVSGVDARRDSRSLIVRSYTAQSRLAAYIVPSRAVLLAENDLVVLWFDDSRHSDTVHATEVRWLEYSSNTRTIQAHFVEFPDNWTTVEKWLRDREYPRNANWRTVLNEYRTAGHLESVTLVDGVSALRVTIDQNRALDSRHVLMQLTFADGAEDLTTQVAGTLRNHTPPLK